jgi:hypothetical protein
MTAGSFSSSIWWNARLEQESWTHVRQPVGYVRLEGQTGAPLLDDLCHHEWGWSRNFLCPVMKDLRAEIVGSRKKSVSTNGRLHLANDSRLAAGSAAAASSPSCKNSSMVWILSRSSKTSKPSCALCCGTKPAAPWARPPEPGAPPKKTCDRLVHKPVALAWRQRPSRPRNSGCRAREGDEGHFFSFENHKWEREFREGLASLAKSFTST